MNFEERGDTTTGERFSGMRLLVTMIRLNEQIKTKRRMNNMKRKREHRTKERGLLAESHYAITKDTMINLHLENKYEYE